MRVGEPRKVVADGGGDEKNTEGGSGVEGVSGNKVVEEGIKGGGMSREHGKVESGEAASGGVGSVLGGKGQSIGGDIDVDKGGEVAVVAPESTPVVSPGRGASAFSVQLRSKTQSPSRLGGNGAPNNAPGSEVSPQKWSPIPCLPEPYTPTKLLVFNVHGTLLDTSLLSQPNPNPNIRVTKKTKTRRFVFRPWMMEFLGRCFKTFKVGFWGLKSGEYMEEVLREILPVFEHLEGHSPIFAWCGKDCEITNKSDDVTIWGKPLTKVWNKWPCWDGTNTIIVDHHAPRVACNPKANVIVPPSFYVTNMKDLAEDNEYLKLTLWPALQALYTHQDVGSFWSNLNVSGLQAGVCEVIQFLGNMAELRPCTVIGD